MSTENSCQEIKAIDFNKNAFDILRLLAAFQVMFGHMAEHFSHEHPDFPKWLTNVLTFSQYIPGRGVIIFFAISGFLVIPSINRYKVKQYLLNKGIRIFPGLWSRNCK